MQYFGKFIVFEGLSGNTKTTQVAMLMDSLRAGGAFYLKNYKFPQYDKDAVGKLIKEDYLAGTFGDPMEMHPKIASLPFLLDRLRAVPEIQKDLQYGYTVVSDRWWPTNAAYQGAKLPADKRDLFWKWLASVEFDCCKLLQEHVGIYLRISPEMSLRNVEARGAKFASEGRDGQEKTDQSQIERFACYEALLKTRPNWHTIECLNEAGELRSREDIHADVLTALDT